MLQLAAVCSLTGHRRRHAQTAAANYDISHTSGANVLPAGWSALPARIQTNLERIGPNRVKLRDCWGQRERERESERRCEQSGREKSEKTLGKSRINCGFVALPRPLASHRTRNRLCGPRCVQPTGKLISIYCVTDWEPSRVLYGFAQWSVGPALEW